MEIDEKKRMGGEGSVTIQKFNHFLKNSNISGCLTPRALAAYLVTMFQVWNKKDIYSSAKY